MVWPSHEGPIIGRSRFSVTLAGVSRESKSLSFVFLKLQKFFVYDSADIQRQVLLSMELF